MRLNSTVLKHLLIALRILVFIKRFRPNDLGTAEGGSRERSPTREDESIPLLRSLSVKDRGIAWDLNLARMSLLLAGGSVCGLALAKRTTSFSAAIVSSGLSSGFLPTMQSYALEAYRRRGGQEMGRLFGALAVVQVVGGYILGPLVFGFVYAGSIGHLPKLIFVVADILIFLSFFVMLFVRVPHDYSHLVIQAE